MLHADTLRLAIASDAVEPVLDTLEQLDSLARALKSSRRTGTLAAAALRSIRFM